MAPAVASRLQLCRATGQRLPHQPQAGEDQPANKSAVCIQAIHRGCGAGDDHEAGVMSHLTGRQQCCPAVVTQLAGFA